MPEGKPPTKPDVLAMIPVMRAIVIGFWLVMLALLWPSPYEPLIAKLAFTVVISIIVGLGLMTFHIVGRQARRQQWLDTGCCINCGYDLKATPDRCPECGTCAYGPHPRQFPSKKQRRERIRAPLRFLNSDKAISAEEFIRKRNESRAVQSPRSAKPASGQTGKETDAT